jgi:hypothetical protein
MSSKQAKTTESVETFSGPILRQVEVRYMVVDSHGGSDEVLHKGYISALESLLNDRGIGDELLAMLHEDDVIARFRKGDENAIGDWLYENQKLVEEKMAEHGYRVVNVLKFKETK